MLILLLLVVVVVCVAAGPYWDFTPLKHIVDKAIEKLYNVV